MPGYVENCSGDGAALYFDKTTHTLIPVDGNTPNGTYYAYATTTCILSISTTSPATTTPPVYTGTFSAGEALVAFLLLVGLFLRLVQMSVKSI